MMLESVVAEIEVWNFAATEQPIGFAAETAAVWAPAAAAADS